MAAGSQTDKVDPTAQGESPWETMELMRDLLRRRLRARQAVMDESKALYNGTTDLFPQQRIQRPIPITIHLSAPDDHYEVQQALTDLLSAFDFMVIDALLPIEGSWYRAFVARLKTGLTAAELSDRLKKVERGIDLHLLHKKQAEVDSLQGDAVAKLLKALAGTPNAVIQIGSVLLIKVDGVPAVRNLSQRELMFLELNPSLLRNPSAFLDALQQATPDAGRLLA
jgi:hypothetical protein